MYVKTVHKKIQEKKICVYRQKKKSKRTRIALKQTKKKEQVPSNYLKLKSQL